MLPFTPITPVQKFQYYSAMSEYNPFEYESKILFSLLNIRMLAMIGKNTYEEIIAASCFPMAQSTSSFSVSYTALNVGLILFSPCYGLGMASLPPSIT